MLTESKILKSDILNRITWSSSSSKQTENVLGASSCDSIEDADAALLNEEQHTPLRFFLTKLENCPVKRRGTGKISFVDKFWGEYAKLLLPGTGFGAVPQSAIDHTSDCQK